jgi:ribosomal protein S18 acetylase RimI-like enzyme
MVSLRKMTKAEFLAFLSADIPAYANEKVRAGNWTAEEALARSKDEHDRLFPRGSESPHQHLFTIELMGMPVGRLWLSTDPQTSGGAGFIYDLFVDEGSRRQGVATQAMILLEGEARKLGLTSLALHVFGYNVAARSLYEQLGYQVTNLNMQKSIAAKPSS